MSYTIEGHPVQLHTNKYEVTSILIDVVFFAMSYVCFRLGYQWGKETGSNEGYLEGFKRGYSQWEGEEREWNKLDQKDLVDFLNREAEPNEAMQELAEEYRRDIAEGRIINKNAEEKDEVL